MCVLCKTTLTTNPTFDASTLYANSIYIFYIFFTKFIIRLLVKKNKQIAMTNL